MSKLNPSLQDELIKRENQLIKAKLQVSTLLKKIAIIKKKIKSGTV